MPGVHWPVYVYTDIPVNTVDIAVESTPLHGLHNAAVVHDNTDAIAVPDSSITSTDKHLTMLFEGTTVQQQLALANWHLNGLVHLLLLSVLALWATG